MPSIIKGLGDYSTANSQLLSCPPPVCRLVCVQLVHDPHSRSSAVAVPFSDAEFHYGARGHIRPGGSNFGRNDISLRTDVMMNA